METTMLTLLTLGKRQFTEVPLAVKLFKLLVNELSNQIETSGQNESDESDDVSVMIWFFNYIWWWFIIELTGSMIKAISSLQVSFKAYMVLPHIWVCCFPTNCVHSKHVSTKHTTQGHMINFLNTILKIHWSYLSVKFIKFISFIWIILLVRNFAWNRTFHISYGHFLADLFISSSFNATLWHIAAYLLY